MLEQLNQNGYSIIRSMIPGELCQQVIKFFNNDVKVYEGNILRFPTYAQEANKFDSFGHVKNRIAELQSINKPTLENFISACFNVVINQRMLEEISSFFGEEPAAGQTFYFESNNGRTLAHQDLFYIPNTIDRTMTAWIALEDINPAAGGLYVYPESHRLERAIELAGNRKTDFKDEVRYLGELRRTIKTFDLRMEVPQMNMGDVILFDGVLIHGSLQTQQPEYSRNSITGHFLPLSKIKSIPKKIINGMQVIANPTQFY